MTKLLLVALLPLLLLVGGCATTTSTKQPAALKAAYQITPAPTTYGFEQAGESRSGTVLTRQYVRGNDTVEEWVRLVTVLHNADDLTPLEMAAQFTSGLKRECPNAGIAVRPVAEGQYLVEYSHVGCPLRQDLHGVRKYLQAPDGIYVIAFEMTNAVFSEIEFSEWRKRIRAAKLEAKPMVQPVAQ
jgi:hypothetical protein